MEWGRNARGVIELPGPHDIRDDKTGEPCAACGDAQDYRLRRALVKVEGIRMMLCLDYRTCCRRFRATS